MRALTTVAGTLAVAGVALAGTAPANANAATVKCRHDVAAHNLPAKTYGYAPPCLVAETIEAHVMQAPGFPKFAHPQGARWTAGKWRVRYRWNEAYDEADVIARRIGHPRQRVTFGFIYS